MAKKKATKKTQKNTHAKSGAGKKAGSWFVALLIALAIVAFVRLFMFQTYTVRSSSMSKTLLPGDWVLINKINYGARMPITLLSVPFAPIRYEANSPKLFIDWIRLPFLRLPGFNKICRNDVVACNYPLDADLPLDKRIVYMKRLIALPGDTFQIKNNKVFVNRKESKIKNAQFEYRVELKSRRLSSELIEKYHLYEGGMLNNSGEYTMYLTESAATLFSAEKSVQSVTRDLPVAYSESNTVFPFNDSLNWTLANYGSIIVPKKGKSIPINLQTINLYEQIIRVYEGNTVEIKNNKVFVNNLPIQTYFFKYNYYFVLDDNRDNAKDSRQWGFLPESHIIGKASIILASFNPSLSKGIIRWNRLFKKVE